MGPNAPIISISEIVNPPIQPKYIRHTNTYQKSKLKKFTIRQQAFVWLTVDWLRAFLLLHTHTHTNTFGL